MFLASALIRRIDALNEIVGRAVSWLALAMVLLQLVVVIMRYVFGLGSLFMQESIVYMHGILFMAAVGYTLLHNGHVRVDIFYRTAPPRTKAMVNLAGVVFFLLPVCVLVWWMSWPYIAMSWSVLEGSRETSGIPALFLLKSVILVFAALLFLQGLSLGLRSLLLLLGRQPPPEVEDADEAV